MRQIRVELKDKGIIIAFRIQLELPLQTGVSESAAPDSVT